MPISRRKQESIVDEPPRELCRPELAKDSVHCSLKQEKSSLPAFHDSRDKLGLPQLRYATDAGGDRFLIKSWFIAPGDKDLEEFWSYELRQLRRLTAYAGTEDFLAPIVNTGADDYGFHAIVALEQKHVLSELLNGPAPSGSGPIALDERALTWQNLSRIVRGLRVLHGRGLTHQNLDRYAILTTGRKYEIDFQLTGFEWSVRGLGEEYGHASGSMQGKASDCPFRLDWRALGILAAELLQIDLHHVCSATPWREDVLPAKRLDSKAPCAGFSSP